MGVPDLLRVIAPGLEDDRDVPLPWTFEQKGFGRCKARIAIQELVRRDLPIVDQASEDRLEERLLKATLGEERKRFGNVGSSFALLQEEGDQLIRNS
jgi:hypothetical protein